MTIRSKNAVVLSVEEVTPGVEQVPSAATDAFRVENPTIDFNPNIVETDETTGSLDSEAPIIGGMTASIGWDVFLKGSGDVATPPDWGELMKACAFAEVITAATPGAPEAAVAGGTTTSVVLGASAVSTDQIYRGMPLDLTGAVVASTFIADYDGATKTATVTDTLPGAPGITTNWQIPANILYRPASINVPSHTVYVYMDGIRYRFVGVRGSVRLVWGAGGPARMTFAMSGLFLAKDDQAVPVQTVDSTIKPIWRNGKMLVNRVASGLAELSLDAGVGLTNPPNPNAVEGFDPAESIRRNMTGSMDPNETLVATRDIMTDFRGGTPQILHAVIGTAVGNRAGLTIPAATYRNQTPGNRDGVASVTVPFSAAGQDSGAFLCLY